MCVKWSLRLVPRATLEDRNNSLCSKRFGMFPGDVMKCYINTGSFHSHSVLISRDLLLVVCASFGKAACL